MQVFTDVRAMYKEKYTIHQIINTKHQFNFHFTLKKIQIRIEMFGALY